MTQNKQKRLIFIVVPQAEQVPKVQKKKAKKDFIRTSFFYGIRW